MTNLEWLLLIVLICGCFTFVFWIAMTIVEARHKEKEEYDPFYEPYACAQCGNYTVRRHTGWAICDSCGMKVEMDNG